MNFIRSEITGVSFKSAHRGLHTKVLRSQAALGAALAVLLGGCFAGESEPDVGWHRAEATVADFVTGTCSTGGVYALSMQVAEEVTCLMPGAFERYEEVGNIHFDSSSLMPYASAQAKADLLAAAASTTRELSINSGYRTVIQQYLLRKWFEQGRCGITAAAQPGSSNHESGRAIDIDDYGYWSTVLPAYGWVQTVPGDPVHFDHLDSPDLRGSDVLAFQRLWNRNNPGDVITEDGQYGPQTAARIVASPAEGFPIGGCPTDQYDALLVAIDAPESMAPGSTAEVVIEIENTGDAPWRPDATFLGTTAPQDRVSPFYDAETWYGPDRPTSVEAETQPGEIGVFRFVLAAPAVEDDAVYSESFGLVEETVTWFGPQELSFDVMVGEGGDDVDIDPPDDTEPSNDLAGGCAAGGGAGGAAALLLLLALPRRRRTTR